MSKNTTCMKYNKLTLLLIGLLLINCKAIKAESIDVKITGNIRYSPCKVNNESNLQIAFDSIEIEKIDGKNFPKVTSVDVICTNYKGTPYIKLSSSNVSEGSNILKTSGVNSSSLGIALYQGDGVDTASPLKIGSGTSGHGYAITKGLSAINAQKSTFKFTAVPYKYGNTALQAGSFEATMTMSIEYF